MDVRTRIAPSPTGPLHVGTARTALFSFLFAKKNKGSFVLRIEDTDVLRSDKRFEKDILENLAWLGIQWDEGPYRQSERISIYGDKIKFLLEEGKAFWCPHTEKELSKERDVQTQVREAPRHVCDFRDKKLEKGEVGRYKNNESEPVAFDDLIRGEISFRPELLGDFAIAKLASPSVDSVQISALYNFVVVVDDEDMKISHIIRGEDHISNTPKQILIQRALGLSRPIYAHLPLILAKDRSKLSKRHGAVSVFEYRQEGYLKEALVNFMALLGWHPENEKEIFSLKELIDEFSLERVQKSAALFDIEKLNWLNKEYLKTMPLDALKENLEERAPENWQVVFKSEAEAVKKIIELERTRITKLADFKEEAIYFFEEPEYQKELLQWKPEQKFEAVKVYIDKLLEILQSIDSGDFTKECLEERIMPYAEEKGRGEVLWPFRAALSGRKASAGPFEIAGILGKEKSIARLKKALEALKT